MDQMIKPVMLRAPDELAVTPFAPRRVLIVGSCLSEAWAHRMRALPEPCESDIYLLGTDLPDEPRQPPASYDFQIVQLALRFVLPDGAFARLGQDDLAGHQRLLTHAVNATRRYFVDAMRWNRRHGLLTFVFPYLVPTQNPVGRLLPRYDLRNPVYFVEKLNEALGEQIAAHRNTYLLDLNEIHGFFGRRLVQEDVFMAINHGGYVSDFDFEYDQTRLEPSPRASAIFEQDNWFMFTAAWQELLSMCRSLRRIDAVKMVVIDLDDTLWRGVTADLDADALPTSEGWPKGLWEALLLLKRRGILLAVVSKNDEARVRGFWDRIFQGQLALEDFAAYRINWRSKPENLAEILAQVNLLPGNLVYVDDNPAERAAVAAAFPGIRTLGGSPLTWRRVLLWSAETQVAEISPESAARTEMMQAQIRREEQRQQLSRDEFLATLGVTVTTFEIADNDHPRFARALELLNKTNQFNTTGARWSLPDAAAFFGRGGVFLAWEAADRYTRYGLVGVLALDQAGIVQLVMSCRVVGLETEFAAISHALALFRAAGVAQVFAGAVATEHNLPCREIFAQCGFTAVDGGWQRTTLPLAVPAHIGLGAGEAAAGAAGSAFVARLLASGGDPAGEAALDASLDASLAGH